MTHLDQVVELERGEAAALGHALSGAWKRAMSCFSGDPVTRRATTGEYLAVAVFEKLARRLFKRHEWELAHPPAFRKSRARPAPWRLRLHGEELAVVMTYCWPHATIFDRVVLGKIQQKSLNIEYCLNFFP